MAGVNSWTGIGNLGHTPEVKYTQSNQMVVNLSVATTESWKDKASGEWQEKTQWHRVVCWDRAADAASKLVKGQQVYVEGKLEYRTYQGKDGSEKTATEIRANRVLRLGKLDAPAAAKPEATNWNPAEDDSSDLPF
jgi:single-strand DNA-binding protein